jgi:hypothetical protein
MSEMCWISWGLRGRVKKKLEKYKLSDKSIGFGEKTALIRYYLKKDVTSADDFCVYWSEIEFLAKVGILTMAQVPLKLS